MTVAVSPQSVQPANYGHLPVVPPAPLQSNTDLGNSYEIIDTLPSKHVESRAKRMELRRVAADLLPDDRVASCGQFLIPDAKGVDIVYQEGNGAHLTNVAVCGGAWVCPVCAAAAAAEREKEVLAAVERASVAGFHTPMVTFTLRHSPKDRLEHLLAHLGEAMAKTLHGLPWRRFKEKHGIVHHVYTLEIRVGKNGWHPHRHIVFFSSRAWDDAEAVEIQSWLGARFSKFLAKCGGYASKDHGVEVSTKGSAKQYLTKWVLELTSSEGKRGESKTPLQLLEAYKDGDKYAGMLFVEYSGAIKGKHQLRWSKGSAKWLELLPEVEVVEEDVQPEPEKITLGHLSRREYRTITKARAEADLIRVASSGSRVALHKFLRRFGIGEFSKKLSDLMLSHVELEGDGVLLSDVYEALERGDYVSVKASAGIDWEKYAELV